jgi:hypothetical protein
MPDSFDVFEDQHGRRMQHCEVVRTSDRTGKRCTPRINRRGHIYLDQVQVQLPGQRMTEVRLRAPPRSIQQQSGGDRIGPRRRVAVPNRLEEQRVEATLFLVTSNDIGERYKRNGEAELLCVNGLVSERRGGGRVHGHALGPHERRVSGTGRGVARQFARHRRESERLWITGVARKDQAGVVERLCEASDVEQCARQFKAKQPSIRLGFHGFGQSGYNIVMHDYEPSNHSS